MQVICLEVDALAFDRDTTARQLDAAAIGRRVNGKRHFSDGKLQNALHNAAVDLCPLIRIKRTIAIRNGAAIKLILVFYNFTNGIRSIRNPRIR